MRKPILPYANNKDTDQPAHPRSLISVFVIRCPDNIMPLVSLSEITSLLLASVAAQTLVENPEERFSHDVVQLCIPLL